MSVGDIAGLIAAIAFVALVIFLAVPCSSSARFSTRPAAPSGSSPSTPSRARGPPD
ncbi:DUF948 domain-containing protein [Georgenia sp. SUBG003]|uniref:DUF948 domain-containing protein n=1 Tax=Georgenia sp. SUBG003 TaxID=1497974 RepID=UPI003AB64FF1